MIVGGVCFAPWARHSGCVFSVKRACCGMLRFLDKHEQRHWPGTDWTKAGAGLIGQSQGPGTDWTMAGAGTDWTTPGAMD